MELHAVDRRLMSVDLVQNWVNNLPPLNPSTGFSGPSSSSTSDFSSTTASSENSHSYSNLYSASHVGSSAHIHPSEVDSESRVPIEPSNKPAPSRCEKEKPPVGHGVSRRNSRLSWMHSNYGSFNSETSSIDLLLEERRANPEQILMNLGFGISDPSIGARLPTRFLAGQTRATGISMQSFLRDHPELSRYMSNESSFAMGELYSRLPQCYRQVSNEDAQTTLHKKFSQSSLDLRPEHPYAPLTVHQGEDGTMFASILTKSNTEQLARQGFYSEHSSPPSLVKQSSSSSISTHDCTIDSVDTPSPIVLNNNPSESSFRNPFMSTQSSGSDSVFSSTESYSVENKKVRAKLQAIHEKSLNEMNEDDLEEGISFVCRRHSDGELPKQDNSYLLPDNNEDVNIHEKRKNYARRKSRSFNEDSFTHLLRDKLKSCTMGGFSADASRQSADAPVIITTNASHDSVSEPIVPKQLDGMLQVSFNPESFDSVDSDTGTIVPSPYASPYQGMSPNASRHGSLGVLPAMESFELEEVQSTEAGYGEPNVPVPTSKRRKVKLQRSVSEHSDSDSSGIADVDGKSHNGQNDSPESKYADGSNATSQNTLFLSLPVGCQTDGSISSSNQTLNSTNTSRTSTSCVTVINQHAVTPPRRSSESDVSDIHYYSAASSAISPAPPVHSSYSYKQYQDAECQTERLLCPCCGNYDNFSVSSQNADWQVNNIPAIEIHPTSVKASATPNGSADGRNRTPADANRPTFYLTTSETESEKYAPSQGGSAGSSGCTSADNQNNSAHNLSSEDHKVEEVCSEMMRDLTLLRELFAKYDIGQPASRRESSSDHDSVRQEIVSSIQAAKYVLSPESVTPCHGLHSIQPESSSPFVPISADSFYNDENFNKGKRTFQHPDLLPGSRPNSRVPPYNRAPKLHDDSRNVPTLRHDRYGGSIGSTPNSHTASSTSSSLSRLEDQLKLTERKFKYEKQIANLEIQKYKLTVQMKDEEIDFWKSLSE